MSKNIYVIVNKRTGKPVTESARLPFFWNKKIAIDRSREIVNSEVKDIPIDNLYKLLSVGWKKVPAPIKKSQP